MLCFAFCCSIVTYVTSFNLLGYTLFYAYVLSHFSCVRLYVTLWTLAHQDPLSNGILQARILEWVVLPFSRGSSQPRD